MPSLSIGWYGLVLMLAEKRPLVSDKVLTIETIAASPVANGGAQAADEKTKSNDGC